MAKYIAIDTECTGGSFQFGDRPYYVSTCDEEGNIASWEFDVTPARRVIIPQSFYREFTKVVGTKIPVFHNANFDLRALASIEVPQIPLWISRHSPEKSGCGRVNTFVPAFHDTLIASHVYRNIGSHGLKDLAFEFLDIEDDDEKVLLNAIRKARNIAKKLGWKVVDRDHADSGDKSESWLKMDGWVPRAVYLKGRANHSPHFLDVLAEYGDRDAERTIALFLFFKKALEDATTETVQGVHDLWAVYLEQLQVIPVIYRMVNHGVSLNLQNLSQERSRYLQEQASQIGILRKLSGNPDLNPNSPKQLVDWLVNTLGAPIVKTTKTGVSLDKHALPLMLAEIEETPLRSPEKTKKAKVALQTLMEYRKVSKSLDYLDQYEEFRNGTDRIHPSYNQTGTRSTRLSASNPNIQQVGKGQEWEDEEGSHSDFKIRKVFGPLPGRIWFCLDYKWLQLGIFAHIVGEKSLIDGFSKGLDPHDTVARRLYGIGQDHKPSAIQRRDAKAVNFGYIFGKSEKNLDKIQPGLGSLVRSMFPTATEYLAETQRKLRAERRSAGTMSVVTRGGYPLHIPEDEERGDRPYAGVCYEVQGTEGILVKRAMVSTDAYCKEVSTDPRIIRALKPCRRSTTPKNGLPVGLLPNAFLSFQVHDELGFDFIRPVGWKVEHYRPYITTIRDLMVAAGKSVGIPTPVSISVVETDWASPQELDW